MLDRNYYQELGIENNATRADIEKAYYNAVFKCRMDYDTGYERERLEIIKKLAQAYDILSNQESRMRYDLEFPRVSSTTHFSKAHTLFNMHTHLMNNEKLYLPTSAIFTNVFRNPNKINLILLGSKKMNKSAFVTNLFNLSDSSHSSQSTNLDYKTLSLTKYTDFEIYDLAKQDNPSAITRSYFYQADIILIFDDADNYLEQCKKHLSARIEQCEVIPLTYLNNSYSFDCSINLNSWVPMTSTLEYRDPHTAHMLCRELFAGLESMFRDKLEKNKADDDLSPPLHLDDRTPTRTRRGCC